MGRFGGSRAETRPDHSDPGLRGRRYAIPFEEVWSAAKILAGSELPRWTLVEADDREGWIRAESRTRLFGFVDDVEIRIGLDPEGQTRVDLTSASRKGAWDLGTNARRVRHFLGELDRALEARGHATLPPMVPGAGAPAGHEG